MEIGNLVFVELPGTMGLLGVEGHIYFLLAREVPNRASAILRPLSLFSSFTSDDCLAVHVRRARVIK